MEIVKKEIESTQRENKEQRSKAGQMQRQLDTAKNDNYKLQATLKRYRKMLNELAVVDRQSRFSLHLNPEHNHSSGSIEVGMYWQSRE